jgi:hypothetical protein
MRVFLIFICIITLVCFAPEVHAGKHKDKKSDNSGTASQSTQKAQGKSGNSATPKIGGKAYGRNGGAGQPGGNPAQWSKPEGAGKTKSPNSWNNSSSVNYSKKRTGATRISTISGTQPGTTQTPSKFPKKERTGVARRSSLRPPMDNHTTISLKRRQTQNTSIFLTTPTRQFRT